MLNMVRHQPISPQGHDNAVKPDTRSAYIPSHPFGNFDRGTGTGFGKRERGFIGG